jgi:hypothetical protein
MTQHVGMDVERHLGGLAEVLDEPVIGPPRSETNT